LEEAVLLEVVEEDPSQALRLIKINMKKSTKTEKKN